MVVGEEEIEDSLPDDYNVESLEDRGNKFQVYESAGNQGATLNIGETDGTPFIDIDAWAGPQETIFVGQDNSSETFFEEKWIDDIFSDQEIDYELKAATTLEAGYKEAYQLDDKVSQAETLIEAAEKALEYFDEAELEVNDYVFNSSDDSSTLGSSRLKYDSFKNMEFDFAQFDDPEWSTSAAYVSSLVLLQDSDKKPAITTGYGYKPSHENREPADIDLVQKAQEISTDEYDFFN